MIPAQPHFTPEQVIAAVRAAYSPGYRLRWNNVMSNSPPPFTDEQVVAAIRAAFSPRWDTALSQEEAASHATTYRANLAHYRQHVQRSLDESDYRQVAEKSWGAFTQILKAIGADHQIKLSSHVGIFRVAGELASLVGQLDSNAESALNNATGLVHSLHTHFYENDLTDAVVIQSAVAVSEAIDRLQHWFPP